MGSEDRKILYLLHFSRKNHSGAAGRTYTIYGDCKENVLSLILKTKTNLVKKSSINNKVFQIIFNMGFYYMILLI